MQKLGPNAEKVLLEKGIIKEGEDFSSVLKRVAKNIAQIETPERREYWENKFFDIMDKNYFLPNFPTLLHGAREDGQILGNLSACFVLDIEDSLDGILKTLHDAGMIQKNGGGTGFSFSNLRSKSSKIASTNGVTNGPISFMEGYDYWLGYIIKQGGVRPGASMGCLSVYHPDIEEFIAIKKDRKKLTNFNLSVVVDDYFMERAKAGETIELKDPHSGKITKEINASILLKEIVKNAKDNGCPGLLFIDTANRDNPFDKKYNTTNPCGETYLWGSPAPEACNLGALNFKQLEQDGILDSDEEFYKIVETSVRFLDNVIDLNNYPLPGMKEMATAYRKIGLGGMGVADVLIAKKLPYNSELGRDFVEDLYKKLTAFSVKTSEELGKEKGFFGAIAEAKIATPRRNSYITLQMPTGTLSILANCSPGPEPWFGWVMKIATSKSKEPLKIINSALVTTLKRKKLWGDGTEILDQIERNNGSIQNIKTIPDDIKEIFVTALDMNYEDHILMQARIQKHVHNGVSKTINMKKDTSYEDVEKAFYLAHNLGCKGITVYLDGTKSDQPVTASDKAEVVKETKVLSREKVLAGETEKFNLGSCGSMLVNINSIPGTRDIREVIVTKGSSGSCVTANIEATSRLITLCRKHKVPNEEIVEQLGEIKCDNVCWDTAVGGQKPDKLMSCPNTIGVAIKRFAQRNNIGAINYTTSTKKCPKCGGDIQVAGGCEYCSGCGNSKC
jgi:ribonucleoside-diphosphate reductase alpha chain